MSIKVKKRKRRSTSLLLLLEEEDANETERLNTTQKKIVNKSQAPGRPGDFTSASLTTQTLPSRRGAALFNYAELSPQN